jgi:hypothetical protein
MKSISKLLTLALLTVFAVSCSEDSVNPRQSDTPAVEEAGGHLQLERPGSPCGAYQTIDLVNETGDVMGNVELVNDNSFLYLIPHMQHGWVITDMKLHTGKHQNAPVHSNGRLNTEAFAFQHLVGRYVNETSVRIPVGPLSACSDLFLFVKSAEVDWFGNIINSDNLWLDGTAFSNGMYFTFCKSACTPSLVNSSGTI